MNHILTITEHEQIIVGKERDFSEFKKIISYEDREFLFDIEFIDKNNRKRYIFKQCGKNRIKADSIVGSISLKNGLVIEILPKFTRDDLTKESIIKYRKTLLNMIKVSNERNFIISQSQNSKISMGEMPLINYIIELFSSSLLNTLRNGLFLSYSNNIDNSSKVKGNILISKTIQNNFIDKSKVYTSYNRHCSNNLLMQIFRTLSTMLLKDNNLSYSTKQNLYEIYMLLNDVSIIHIKNEDFEKIVFNRLNDHYEVLLNQAKFIFNKYMPFTSQINSTPFWSILFDMDYLFEKFISYLFRKSNIDFVAQDTTDCYFNDKFTVTAKPDFVIKSNKLICVADAKWKLLDEDKTLYGLNAQNFWQLYSYMDLLFENNQLNGYFIVPKNNDSFEDEILFNSNWNKNKSIVIIGIDFSLDFNEIKDNFYFEILNNELKYCKKEENLLNNDIEQEVFNFEEFINELEILHKDKQLLKRFLKNIPQQKEIYKNIFYLKNIQEVNTSTFKKFIKENLDGTSLVIDGLNLISIPSNINKLKNLEKLVLKNNNIKEIPSQLFTLKKLRILDLSHNLIENIPIIINQMIDLNILKLNGNKIISIDVDFVELKNLRELHIDKIVFDKNKNILKNLKELYNTKIFYYDENNLETEYIIKNLTKEEVEIYNQKDDYELIEIASEKSLREDFKIILFYKEYNNYDTKIKIQQILKQNSNKDINDYLFEKTITEIINLFKKDFDNIYSIHKEWIFGFLFCNNNKAVFEIKKIIAEKTNSKRILEILSDEKNERKILNEVVNNKYITIDIINKIVEFTIEYDYEYVARSLVKISNVGFENIKNIIIKFENSSIVELVKKTKYEKNDLIQNWINEEFPEPIINLYNYDESSRDEKYYFAVEARFNTYPEDLIKKLCYEIYEDILLEILADKHESLKLRFVVLIYILNFKNLDFKNKEIFNAIQKYDNEQLNDIIELNENSGIESVVKYLEENFHDIDKEILLGYSMSNISSVFYVRDKICDLTLDLDILNELSKNANDETILKKIIFKAKYNKNFQEMVRGYNTKYSKEILTRISQYDRYFEPNNEYCLICHLAKDYYNTTIETKYYLYNNYAKEKKDKVLLNILLQSLKNTIKDELVQLRDLVFKTLKELENNISSKIEF